MQVILKKPIYLGGTDVGRVGHLATVDEMRGRELIKKGYASAPQADGDKVAQEKAKADAAAKAAADEKAKADAAAKADADEKAKADAAAKATKPPAKK